MVNLTDAAGTVVESCTYDEYGRPLMAKRIKRRNEVAHKAGLGKLKILLADRIFN